MAEEGGQAAGRAADGEGGGGSVGMATPAQPRPRQTVYSSQPVLRIETGQASAAGNGAGAAAGEAGGDGGPPAAAGAAAGSKRAPLEALKMPPKRQRLDYRPDADADTSPRSRHSSPRSGDASPTRAPKGETTEPMRPEYAGGRTPSSLPSSPLAGAVGLPAGSPYAAASPAAGQSPFAWSTGSSLPGGQWVWRADIPGPNGSLGAWVWAAAPQAPAPPPMTAAAPPLPYGPGPGPGGYFSPGPPGYPGGQQPGPGYGGPAAPWGPAYDHHMHHYPGASPYGPPTPFYPGGPPPGMPMPAQHRPYGPYPLPPMGPLPPMQHFHRGQPPPPPGPPPLHLQQGQFQGQARPGMGGSVPRTPPAFKLPPLDAKHQVAVEINKRITAATTAREIFDIVQHENASFDTVCLATAMHRLAGLQGAPGLHAQIVHAPEFFRLKTLILQRRSEFTARNLSNTLWSLAKATHHPGDEFLAAMAEEVKKKACGGNAQNTANIVWAFATLGFHPGDEVMQALAAAVKSKLSEFTAQNMSNTVLAFAKLEFEPGEDVLEGLAQEALSKIKTFAPQALANTLWGLSKLGIKADSLMEGIIQEARPRLSEFNSQNIANTVWAYANLTLTPEGDIMQDLARAAIQKMPEFSPQNISNVLWAFAKLDVRVPELFAQAAKHSARIMHTFTPQSLANIIWAFATCGECPDHTFLQALTGQALKSLDDFTPQNLSNSAWALGTLRECDSVRLLHKGLVSAICREVAARLADPEEAADFSRQHLTNFAWALATLEHDAGSALLSAVAEALMQRAEECSPQELSNSVWAFAKLGEYHAPLMNTMAAEAARRVGEFSQQNLANTAWAYAKLTHLDDDLMQAIAGRIEELAGELNSQHCTNLCWAFATLAWPSPTLMPTLVREVKARMAVAPFSLQQLTNLLWSLAIAGHCDRVVWDAALAQLDELATPLNELPEESLTQVFQAHMLMLAQSPEGEWPIREALLGLAQNAWVQTTKNVKISEFHAEVSRMLSALGVGHTIEHLTEDHLFSVDIALAEERIALEVDGPRHFTANTFRPLGETNCRHALLAARGWRVVSVPFYHWSGETEKGRQQLLTKLLAEARAKPPPEIHPAQAAASARLAEMQRTFEERLPGWVEGEKQRVAALLREREVQEQEEGQQQEQAAGQAGLAAGPAIGLERAGSSAGPAVSFSSSPAAQRAGSGAGAAAAVGGTAGAGELPVFGPKEEQKEEEMEEHPAREEGPAGQLPAQQGPREEPAEAQHKQEAAAEEEQAHAALAGSPAGPPELELQAAAAESERQPEPQLLQQAAPEQPSEQQLGLQQQPVSMEVEPGQQQPHEQQPEAGAAELLTDSQRLQAAKQAALGLLERLASDPAPPSLPAAPPAAPAPQPSPPQGEPSPPAAPLQPPPLGLLAPRPAAADQSPLLPLPAALAASEAAARALAPGRAPLFLSDLLQGAGRPQARREQSPGAPDGADGASGAS